MFRVIAESASLNCDDLLIQLFQMVKQMQDNGMLDKIPGGMKLPPFFRPEMLSSLPQQQKITMVAQGINQEKERVIPMLQNLAAAQLGVIKIQDLSVEAYPSEGCECLARVDVSEMDTDKILDLLVEQVLKEEDIQEVLGEHYDQNLNMENIGFYLHGQNPATKEYLVLKIMSVGKKELMEKIVEFAAKQNVKIVMKNLRFLMKESA